MQAEFKESSSVGFDKRWQDGWNNDLQRILYFVQKIERGLFIFSLLNLERANILIGASSQHHISSLTFSVYSVKFTDKPFS